MAEVLPINFPLPTENLFASYDWFDTNTGTGIQTFYGKRIYNGTAYKYLLSKSDALISYESEGAGASFDLDFDISFVNTVYIDGFAYITGSFYIQTAGAVYKVSGQLFHYDGSTETAASAEISGPNETAGGGNERKYFCVKIPITTKTKITGGDTLRLTIKLTKVGGTDGVHLEHSATHPFIAAIPFKIIT